MAHSNSTGDRRDLPSYPVVQYIEYCHARLDGRRFCALRLVDNAKGIWDVRDGHKSSPAEGAQIEQ